MLSDTRLTTIVLTASTATLDGFLAIASDADGVNVRALEPLTSILVRTKNSTYHINVQSGTAAVVQGGQFFPVPTSVEVCGATIGGSSIKVGWIAVGLCLELVADGRRIVTTRVRTIRVLRSPGQGRTH